MRFRKLRIAWSVVCGLMAVLLIVLWVRSCTWVDIIAGPWPNKTVLGFCSSEGRLFACTSELQAANDFRSGWIWIPVDLRTTTMIYKGPGLIILVYHWELALVACLLAPLPWIRFSLRTLLIATTLVAVVLELIFARARWPAG